jgi:hypothetical protein
MGFPGYVDYSWLIRPENALSGVCSSYEDTKWDHHFTGRPKVAPMEALYILW